MHGGGSGGLERLGQVAKVYKVDNSIKRCQASVVMTTTLEKRGGKVKLPSNEQAMVDEFTGLIRKHRDEAPTTPVRVARDTAEVGSRARADNMHGPDRIWRDPAEADLRLGGCVATARQGRYCYATGLQSRVVDARGDACGR